MAAGVSLCFGYLLLQILCLCVLLAGTKDIKDVRLASYSLINALPGSELELDIREWNSVNEPQLLRVRRQSDDVTTINDTSSISSTTVATTTTTIAQQSTTSYKRPTSSDVPTSTSTTTPKPTTTTTQPTTSKSPTTTTTVASVVTTTSNATKYNDTVLEEKNHTYYLSRQLKGNDADYFWIPREDFNSVAGKKTHGTLSNSHRTAATIDLSFRFLFYGHEVHKITIATGGFLYTSSFVHQWLTATQYVAPLMANFDTRLGNNSRVHYYDNGTAFAVWWEDIYLKDHPTAETFNFQAVLHEDGTVVFSYKQVPVDITTIPTQEHPVKVGMSDAYYIDQDVYLEGKGQYTRRTIYEYHRVEIKMSTITSNSAVIINPRATCITIKNCSSCIQSSIGFDCKWCGESGRCSDGYDRMRQDWLKKGCHETTVKSVDQCPVGPPGGADKVKAKRGQGLGVSIGIVIAVMIAIVLALVVGWVIYAYTHPNSKPGMWLIEHRPSQWKQQLNQVKFWKRGEGSGKKKKVPTATLR